MPIDIDASALRNTPTDVRLAQLKGDTLQVDVLSGGGTTPASSSLTTAVTGGLVLAASVRKGFTLFNDGGGDLYIQLGGPASSASFSAVLNPQGYYESPFSWQGTVYVTYVVGFSGSVRAVEVF